MTNMVVSARVDWDYYRREPDGALVATCVVLGLHAEASDMDALREQCSEQTASTIHRMYDHQELRAFCDKHRWHYHFEEESGESGLMVIVEARLLEAQRH